MCGGGGGGGGGQEGDRKECITPVVPAFLKISSKKGRELLGTRKKGLIMMMMTMILVDMAIMTMLTIIITIVFVMKTTIKIITIIMIM